MKKAVVDAVRGRRKQQQTNVEAIDETVAAPSKKKTSNGGTTTPRQKQNNPSAEETSLMAKNYRLAKELVRCERNLLLSEATTNFHTYICVSHLIFLERATSSSP